MIRKKNAEPATVKACYRLPTKPLGFGLLRNEAPVLIVRLVPATVLLFGLKLG